MKQTKWIAIAILVAVSGIATAHRIGSTRIVTDVPFDFVVANKTVPAGVCFVEAATLDGSSVMIRNAVAKVSLISAISTAEGKLGADHYALVFTRYGDRYFLSGIKLKGSKISYRVPRSRAEVELIAQKTFATEETLVANRK